MAKPKASRPRAAVDTRSRLLSAAAALFNSVGYFGTDSNRIARRAGYAPGTFYVHFADKLDCFLEVYRQWVEGEWQAIAAVVAGHPSLRSQEARIAGTVLKHHCDWRVFRASLRALTATEERVHRARLAQRKRQIDKVADLLRQRGARPPPARIYQSLLLHEALCDAVADGDADALGVGRRAILAQLTAEVAALLGPREGPTGQRQRSRT